MKCWCFNQEQLELALQAYLRDYQATFQRAAREIIVDFLASPQLKIGAPFVSMRGEVRPVQEFDAPADGRRA
jgi:hypothetical protein